MPRRVSETPFPHGMNPTGRPPCPQQKTELLSTDRSIFPGLDRACTFLNNCWLRFRVIVCRKAGAVGSTDRRWPNYSPTRNVRPPHSRLEKDVFVEPECSISRRTRRLKPDGYNLYQYFPNESRWFQSPTRWGPQYRTLPDANACVG